jgi:type VI secretion system protein ImpM
VWGFLRKAVGGDADVSGASIAVGAFGKIPAMGDFVRVGAVTTSPSFEGWLEAGMAFGEAKHGAAWPSVYDAGAIHAFIYKAPDQAREVYVTVGLVKPSHDRVSRRFPIVIFAQIPERVALAVPHMLPLVMGEFLDGATLIAIDSAGITTAAELASRVAQLPTPTFGPHVAREYDDWARTTPSSHAAAVVYGEWRSERFDETIGMIASTIGPSRGKENPSNPLSVRLPLGAGGPAAATFWLDVVRRVARWKATIPTAFWCFDGKTGTVLVQLGKTPASSLTELWAPTTDNEHLVDLTDGGPFTGARLAMLRGRGAPSDPNIVALLEALARGI